MFKTMDIVKEENISITGRQSSNGAIDGYTVDNPCLPPVAGAEIAPDVFLGDGRHQVIERYDR